jgi:formate dehydrogenase major subunit
MARTIVTEGLCDREFMERRVDVAERFAQFIEAWTPERAAAICDVPASAIRDTARAYAMGPPAISFHGLGLTEHVQGTDGVMALINLALLTGNVGRPGAGINPLRGQNNVQGAAHMGCSPGLLAGSTPVAEGREAFERKWGGPLPATRGRHLLEMLDAAEAGDFKALWAIGYDVLLTNPCTERTARALRALELVVVQDMYLTETARQFGSIFLPACSTFEREGTFMNAERRVQRVRAVLRPAGSSKPDWQILCETARRLGARGFEYLSAAEIWDEVRELVPGARGMTYDRLDAAGLQWPCPQEDHPGTPILHVGSFGKAPRAKLALVEHRGSPETTSADYPFLLNTGRSLYQFNAGTMTMRTPNAELRPADVLDIDPADAASHELSDGEVVRVVSRYGSAVLPVHYNRGLRKGELFATFHTVSTFLNAVTGPHRDSAVGTPEYKLTAVRLERVAGPATPDSSP